MSLSFCAIFIKVLSSSGYHGLVYVVLDFGKISSFIGNISSSLREFLDLGKISPFIGEHFTQFEGSFRLGEHFIQFEGSSRLGEDFIQFEGNFDFVLGKLYLPHIFGTNNTW